MLPPTPKHKFILFDFNFDVKFTLLRLLLFLSDLTKGHAGVLSIICRKVDSVSLERLSFTLIVSSNPCIIFS